MKNQGAAVKTDVSRTPRTLKLQKSKIGVSYSEFATQSGMRSSFETTWKILMYAPGGMTCFGYFFLLF